jgi:hypothetical protein
MRRISKGFAALTLATSGIALAVMGASSPAMAGGGLVTVHTGDIASGNVINANIAPVVASTICGVNVNVIRALTTGDKTDCKILTQATGTQTWITKL